MDPDLAIFVLDLKKKDAKKLFYSYFSASYFLKVHSHHFSKIKSNKEVTKHYESRFFLLIILDDRRIPDPHL
jgi:hypothetical protein